MKIKVCGITSVEQLEQLAKMRIDLAGLIFVETSPRYAHVSLRDQAEEVRNCTIQKVGVFVNEEMKTIKDIINEFGLSAVQLHGDEDPSFSKELNDHIPVVKAFRVSGEEDIPELIKPFANSCSYFLFDTLAKGSYGGTGKTFNWSKLETAVIGKPFFLSGGISPAHVEQIKSFHHSSLFAIDINSRFETKPGIKNMRMVSEFKNELEQTITEGYE